MPWAGCGPEVNTKFAVFPCTPWQCPSYWLWLRHPPHMIDPNYHWDCLYQFTRMADCSMYPPILNYSQSSVYTKIWGMISFLGSISLVPMTYLVPLPFLRVLLGENFLQKFFGSLFPYPFPQNWKTLLQAIRGQVGIKKLDFLAHNSQKCCLVKSKIVIPADIGSIIFLSFISAVSKNNAIW